MDDKKGKEGKAVEKKDDIKRMDGREEIKEKKSNAKEVFTWCSSNGPSLLT